MTESRKKAALVTGASSGMGKEIAKQLMTDGFFVYVAARRVEKMADLGQLGARVLELDIASEAQIQRAAGTILAESGGVDVLVNNAGFGLFGAVEDVSTEEARHQFEVNVFGPARLTQLLLPAMRERRSGTIVNITSMGGKMYTPLGAWYHATKHALEGWSDCLRLELAPFGIRVVIVEPGLIETAFGEVVTEGMQAHSVHGAYEALTRAVTQSTQAAYGHGKNTPASVIAKVVSKAVKAARPRTRYVAGAFARPMLFIRKWFGDRLFDRMIMSQVK